jgi:two-component system, NtrC family, response regulator HydG
MRHKSSVLVVEDHNGEREALIRFLRGKKYAVRGANDAHEAIQHLHNDVAAVISDVRIGSPSGVELMQMWKNRRPSTPFILVSGFDDVDVAVEAMKRGAAEYLKKPVDLDELLRLLNKSMESAHRRDNESKLRNPIARILGSEKIVARSKVMEEVCERVRRAALVESTVLLTGESGTGKELFAEAIHYNSPRRDGPFVTVNMAAVPESLVESELFGHAKGSFTGASESRSGKYEAANGGTLFIDEIGDFALPSQAKLLRVLENHRVTPVGSNKEREVDVRVVAATSRDLNQMVAQGGFREDLYFRLDVIHLHLPPLRERREGIPLLINHFLEELSKSLERPVPVIDPDVMAFLVHHDWPGNVRQLRNCLESMFVLCDGEVLRMNDVPESAKAHPRQSRTEIPSGIPLYELERTAIENALREHDGNRTHAAKALRISVRTLQRKLKEFGERDFARP